MTSESHESRTLSFEQVVPAPPAALYHAFTNSTTLRDWLADVATTAPRPGGRIYLATSQGDYMAGAYTALEPGREVAFTWQGNGEPGPSRVHVSFVPEGEGTRVLLRHEGLGSGPAWAATADALEKGWARSLENLASVLTTGEDLRFTRRPMLGVTISDLNETIAGEIGVPVSEGLRLDSIIEGMGAAAAGLQPNDVVVRIGGREVRDWETLQAALAGHRAGDTVDVAFYRGAEKRDTEMTLSGRPIPELPATPAALAEAVRERYRQLEEELDSFFADVDDTAALYKPGRDNWSAAEVLAHLIHGERYQYQWMANVVSGHEPWQDDWGGNDNAQVAATVRAYPTLDELLGELKRHFQETVAYIEKLPIDLTMRKGGYWRLAYNLLESPYHYHAHVEQMREAIAQAAQPVP